jgi:hypothetical protein
VSTKFEYSLYVSDPNLSGLSIGGKSVGAVDQRVRPLNVSQTRLLTFTLQSHRCVRTFRGNIQYLHWISSPLRYDA